MEEKIILGVAWFAVFLFSTTFHEAAHALLSFKLGDPTAYHGGQVSLNPLPHIQREPFGMVLVPIVSFALGGWMFGWASAPYDPHWAANYPRRAAWMALAGPLSNLLLFIVSGVFIFAGLRMGWFQPPQQLNFLSGIVASTQPGPLTGLALLLSIFFSLNLILFCFNLMPLPPLDGSGALPLIFSSEHAYRYQQFMSQPGFTFLGLIVAWNVFPLIFKPIMIATVNILYPGMYQF